MQKVNFDEIISFESTFLKVFCAQGWMLIARFSNKDTKNWMVDHGTWWYDRYTPSGSSDKYYENYDMISPAFGLLCKKSRVGSTKNIE